MIYRIFKHLLYALRLSILLVLLLFSVLLLLLNNASGSRFLLQQIVHYTPGLSLNDSRGSFLQGLYLDKPRYQYQDVSVSAEQIYLSLQPLALLRGQLRVAKLSSEALHVIIDTETATDAPSSAMTTLPTIRTPFPIRINNVQLNNNRLTINEQTWPIALISAQLSWWQHRIQIEQLALKNPEQQLAAKGQLSMQQEWPINLQLNWQSHLPKNLADTLISPTAKGQLTVQGTIMQLHIEQTIAIGQNPPLNNQLQLQPLATPLRFTLTAQWPAMALQLPQQTLQVEEGELRIAGTIDDYTLQLQSKIPLEEQTTFHLQLKAQGNSQALKTLQLSIREQQQKLQLEGSLHWLPELAWQLKAKAEHINPHLWLAELKGDISAQLHSQGQWGEKADIQLAVEQLSGRLDGRPISGYSRIHWREGKSLHSDTELQAGLSQLSAKGGLSHDKLDFNIRIHSDDLSQLSQQLGGKIQLQASLAGSQAKPQLQANGQAQQIRFADWHIQHISIDADNPHAEQLNGHLQLTRITQGDKLLADALRLESRGNAQNQQLQLRIQREDAQLFAVLDNHWQDKQGQAILQRLDISGDAMGLWSLDTPAIVNYANGQLDLAKNCLRQHQQQGQLCFQAQQKQQRLQARLSLQQFDLAQLAPFIADDIEIYAMLSADAAIEKDAQQLHAHVNIQSTPGYLRYIKDAEEIARVSWQDIQLEAQLEDHTYEAALNIRIDNSNWLKHRLAGNTENQTIAGRLQLQLTQLQLLELISPVRQLQGEIHGDISLSGTLDAPQAQGQIEFLARSLQIPDAGLLIENMRVRLQADKQQWIRLDGELYSGGKPLKLEGSADTQKPFPWPIQLRAHGEDVLALNLDNMRLRIDPDLSIEIHNQWIKTRGEVRVREAQVKLRDLPATAISPSGDTVIIGEEENQTPWFIDSDINIILGDRFSVQGMGLDAKFGGDIRIQDAPQQALSLTGLVNIAEGRYRAYGQNLTIERGQVFFQGPADDPGLDILATRTLSRHNVKVGLEIGGTLKYPRTRVFSDPLMDETEAMSWLLFGKPLSGASENDGSLILQAVAVYGIEQGDFITQNLSDKLGLDVGFDTAGESDQTAFTLGKQLSPRIYLRYSVGLFDNLSTLMVRYQLSQHMHLETQSSGDANSIDLQYKLER